MAVFLMEDGLFCSHPCVSRQEIPSRARHGILNDAVRKHVPVSNSGTAGSGAP